MIVLMVLYLTDNVQLITFGMVSNSEGQFGLAKLFNGGFLSPTTLWFRKLGKTKGGWSVWTESCLWNTSYLANGITLIWYSNQMFTLVFVYSWRKVWKKKHQHDGPVMGLYCPLLVEEKKFQKGEKHWKVWLTWACKSQFKTQVCCFGL